MACLAAGDRPSLVTSRDRKGGLANRLGTVGVLLSVSLLLWPAVSPAARADTDPAFRAIADCVAERGELAALMLIDESGSLQWTDPDNDRITALRAALDALSQAADVGGGQVAVDVAFAAFATEYTLVREWTALNADSLPDLRAEASAFATRNTGLDTDFALALGGTIDELERLAGERATGGIPCRVVFMFTDGDYDLEPRAAPETRPYAPDLPLDVPGNPQRAVEAGRAAVCDRDGLADQLRALEVPIFTVAFTPDIPAEDRGFLRALSQGVAGNERCGANDGPDIGAYVEADDLGELATAFHGIVGQAGGGSVLRPDAPLEICDATVCPKGTFTFELDGALRTAHLLAELVAEDVVVELRGPANAEPYILRAGQVGSAEVAGATIAYAPLSSTALTVQFDLPAGDPAWAGRWTATFVDPTGRHVGDLADAQLLLFGRLEPRLVGDPILRRGQSVELAFDVVNEEASPLFPDELLGELDLSAVVFDPSTGVESTLALEEQQGRWRGSYAPPAETTASSVNVTATVDVRTPGGLALQPRSTTTSLPIAPPAEYPGIEPTALVFAPLVGDGSTTQTLTVQAAQAQTGCVWFTPGDLEQSGRTASLAVALTPEATSPGRCLEVAPGQTREVEVTVTAEGVDGGSAGFPLTAHMTADGVDEEILVTIPASLDLVREVDAALRIGLFLLFLLLAGLLPLGVLYGFAYANAYLRGVEGVRHSRDTVRVEGDMLHCVNDESAGSARGFTLSGPILATMKPRSRSWVHDERAPGLTLQTITPKNPLGDPFVLAIVEGSDVLGPAGSVRRRDHECGVLELALPGQWAFVVTHEPMTLPAQTPAGDSDAEDANDHEPAFAVVGELHVWWPAVPQRVDPLQVEGALLEDIKQQVPRIVQRFVREWITRQAAEDAGGAAATSEQVVAAESPSTWRPVTLTDEDSSGGGAGRWSPAAPHERSPGSSDPTSRGGWQPPAVPPPKDHS